LSPQNWSRWRYYFGRSFSISLFFFISVFVDFWVLKLDGFGDFTALGYLSTQLFDAGAFGGDVLDFVFV